MKDSAALKPASFPMPASLTDKKAEKSGASDEERLLYDLSQRGGWRLFESIAQDLLKELDQGTDTAMAQGLPFEEIGRNAVVVNLAKGIIQKLLQKVQDAKEACESTDGTDK